MVCNVLVYIVVCCVWLCWECSLGYQCLPCSFLKLCFKVHRKISCKRVAANVCHRSTTAFSNSTLYRSYFNACHDKSIRSFLTCSMCLLMMRSECVWAFGEGSNFQLEGLKIEFSRRRSSLTQTFVESFVDFEVAHLSVLMVRRLPYRRFLP